MLTAAQINRIFEECIASYHALDDIDQPQPAYEGEIIEQLVFEKCWIDTVQWHLEDLIRDPDLPEGDGMKLKRRIDRSNQDRTDLVEKIDDGFLKMFENTKTQDDARLNTESPAWVLDRLSILALKIYHMREEAERESAGSDHMDASAQKLAVLQTQQQDLSLAFDQLLEDIGMGRRIMKVYRQMKMYNDPSSNPVLYGKSSDGK